MGQERGADDRKRLGMERVEKERLAEEWTRLDMGLWGYE